MENKEERQDFISTDDELHKFLLGDTHNSRVLTGPNLAYKVDLVATAGHTTTEQRFEAAEMFRTQAVAKAHKDADKYRLGDEDRIALGQLYTGFAQIDLLSRNRGYRVKITEGEKTTYIGLPKDRENTDIPQPRDPNLTMAIRAFPHHLRGEACLPQERPVASSNLWNLILNEFNQVRLLDKGTQIRKSSDPLFKRTALLAKAIINILNTDTLKTAPQVIEAMPINEIKNASANFQAFRDNLGKI